MIDPRPRWVILGATNGKWDARISRQGERGSAVGWFMDAYQVRSDDAEAGRIYGTPGLALRSPRPPRSLPICSSWTHASISGVVPMNG